MKKKILTKISVAIILTLILALVSNSLMPVLGNDIAMSQLENEDAYFVAMQAWQSLQNKLTIAKAFIWALAVAFIVKDFYNHKKELIEKGEN